MLAKSISIDRELNNLSLKSQLIYTWCVPYLDDFGLLTSDTGNIKYLIFPRNQHISEEDIMLFVDEAEKEGLIEQAGDDCFYFKGFAKHNPLTDYKKSKSEFKENRWNKGKSKYSPEIPSKPQENPSKGKVSKGNRREVKNTVATSVTTPAKKRSIKIKNEVFMYEELVYVPLEGDEPVREKSKLGMKTMAVLVRKFAEVADVEIGEMFDASPWAKSLGAIYRHFGRDPDKTIAFIERAGEYFKSKSLSFTPQTLHKNLPMIDKWIEENESKKPKILDMRKKSKPPV